MSHDLTTDLTALRCIVAAWSADEFGTAAVRHAASLARRDGARLVVVNGTLGDSLVDPRFAREADVSALVAGLRAAGLDVEVRHEVVPDIAHAVVAAADEVGADLVVVGVRRRSPVGKALMGSVAQRVILDAHCPVLAVKPD